MRMLLILLPALAIWSCREAKLAKDAPPPPKTGSAVMEPMDTNVVEPMYSKEVRHPIPSSHPSREFRKFTGTVDGKRAFTMEINLKGSGSGSGSYWYEHQAVANSVLSEFYEPDSFEFQLWDSSGNNILETLKGKFSSNEAFEGVWTRYQPDSVQDPEYGTWKKRRIRRERAPFRMTRMQEGVADLSFEVFRKENDSTSRAKIEGHRVEWYYDSLPSSLELVGLQARTGRDSLDSVINLRIDRASKEFLMSRGGRGLPIGLPIADFADSLFARGWRYMKGQYFDEAFDIAVETNGNGVLSLCFSTYDNAGGPHPNFDHAYTSIDLETGKVIGLEDILVPDYQHELGSLAEEPSCDGDSEYPCTITRIVEKGFAIRHGGIVFHARIALRERDLFLSFADLAPLLKPGGILERFRGQDRVSPE